MTQWYKSSFMQRAAESLEKARSEFQTNIDSDINEANIYESESKSDSKESRRESKLIDTDLGGGDQFTVGGTDVS